MYPHRVAKTDIRESLTCTPEALWEELVSLPGAVLSGRALAPFRVGPGAAFASGRRDFAGRLVAS